MRQLVLGLALAASTAAPAMAHTALPYFGGYYRPLPIYRPVPVRPIVQQPVVRPVPNPVQPPRNIITIPDCRIGPC